MKLLENSEGKVLYAVAAALRLPDGTVKPIKRHMHAKNAEDARYLFVSSLPLRARYNVNIMAIGPVVGLWAEEDTRDKNKIIVSV